MKNIMWKYIDVLPSMVEKYNNTYHRSIKLKPQPANYKHINNALYAKVNARKATLPKFHVWEKGTFEKGFTPNWTVFTITAYTIEDTLGEPVQGTFYEQELQPSVREIYRIERVLKKGKDRVLVKWKVYNSAFNSWMPLADLEQL